MDKNNRLYSVVNKFSELDLYPNSIDSIKMGYIFEEVIRKFSETYQADAGEFYTPREIIDLMVNLLLNNEELSENNKVIQIYDGAWGYQWFI